MLCSFVLSFSSFFLMASALVVRHNITVGLVDPLQFSPEFVFGANPGDLVSFIVNPQTNSVVQSRLDVPCIPLTGGFNTAKVKGKPSANVTDGTFTFSFVVPSGKTPLFFYSPERNSCSQGMVFAINPASSPSPKSFLAFQSLAVSQGTSPVAPQEPSKRADADEGSGFDVMPVRRRAIVIAERRRMM